MREKVGGEKEARMHLLIDKMAVAMKQRVTKQCSGANKKTTRICRLRSQGGLARNTKAPDLVQRAIDVACLWHLDCSVSRGRDILKAGDEPVNRKLN